MFQWPGGHPQPISEQQHRVTGGVHGVFRHEEGHSVRALWTHRHLLPLLPSCQEMSHLQRSGPVKNQGIGSSTASPTQKPRHMKKSGETVLFPCLLFNMSFHRLRSASFALTKRQPCCSSPVVTCALAKVCCTFLNITTFMFALAAHI